jgi:hypothetical protein
LKTLFVQYISAMDVHCSTSCLYAAIKIIASSGSTISHYSKHMERVREVRVRDVRVRKVRAREVEGEEQQILHQG